MWQKLYSDFNKLCTKMFKKTNAKKIYYYFIYILTKKWSKWPIISNLGFFGGFGPKYGILDHFKKFEYFFVKAYLHT